MYKNKNLLRQDKRYISDDSGIYGVLIKPCITRKANIYKNDDVPTHLRFVITASKPVRLKYSIVYPWERSEDLCEIISATGESEVILDLPDLSDKYEIFRTNIIYEKLEEPKSVVLDKRKIPFRHFETNSSEEKNRLAEKINEECFEKGFDLQKDALFKIYLIQTNGDSTMLFSFHHILLDGYCAAMIADIIMNSYGRNISKENEYVPFSVYQDWL